MRIGPITIERLEVWRMESRRKEWYGIFRNRDGIKPGRWGFYFLGFEFGSRQPGNLFGMMLKRIGLWPW